MQILTVLTGQNLAGRQPMLTQQGLTLSSLFLWSVWEQDCPPPAPTQLTKLTGEVSSLRSWCLSYRNPPLPLFPVLFMTSPIMVNIWNEQLIIAAMP